MKKHIFWLITMVVGLWIETAFGPLIEITNLKINLVLVLLILFNLRWKSAYLWCYALLFGLMTDALTHGMLGLSGLSFFLTIVAAHWVGEWLYDENFLSTFLFVSLLSFIEGGVVLVLLTLLEPGLSFNSALWGVVIPLSLIHGVISPFLNWIVTKIEQALHLKPDANPPSLVF